MSVYLKAPASRIAIPAYFDQLPDKVAWTTQETTLVEYRRFEDSVQTQVQLDNHLFMLVLHGQKEVHTPQGDLVMTAGMGGVIKKGSYLMSSRRCQDDQYESLLFFLPTYLLQAFALERAPDLPAATPDALPAPRVHLLCNTRPGAVPAVTGPVLQRPLGGAGAIAATQAPGTSLATVAT